MSAAFLLTTSVRGNLHTKTLYPETEDGYSRAVIAAYDFVGEHNPVDGCSTKPQEWSAPSGGGFRVSRGTSFGARLAEVEQVQFAD